MVDKTIKIAGSSAMWGDSLFALQQLLSVKDINYVTIEALAEVTMGILSRMKSKDPSKGYAVDFIDPILRNNLSQIAKRGIKVVSNLGGVNPIDAVKHLEKVCKDLGISLKIAAITGDDIFDQIEKFREKNLLTTDTRKALPNEGVLSMNAYLGAFPIAQALNEGADIIITGRCVDSALTLGPLIHEFGWKASDLDLLSQGSLAGHLLECGPQVTGGLMTDWNVYDSWQNMGYPIAECKANGDFVISKPENTDGIVNIASVSEQLVYEIGDPSAYLLPDVTCDFTEVQLEEIGKDKVLVKNAKGKAPTPTYKAIAQCKEGYRCTYVFMITGRDLLAKSQRLTKDTKTRIERSIAMLGFKPFSQFDIEFLGAESNFGYPVEAKNNRELIIKLSVQHEHKMAINILSRELPSLAVSTIQGFCSGITGRPSPTTFMRPMSYLVDKKSIDAKIKLSINEEEFSFQIPKDLEMKPLESNQKKAEVLTCFESEEEMVKIPLLCIAYARSGDKGNSANIGVIARNQIFFDYLWGVLTPDKVGSHFEHFVKGEIERFSLPSIRAYNFLMQDALSGGGSASLRFDSQGKGLGQNLLELLIDVPKSFLKNENFKHFEETKHLL